MASRIEVKLRLVICMVFSLLLHKKTGR
jgi:hypothetical protein